MKPSAQQGGHARPAVGDAACRRTLTELMMGNVVTQLIYVAAKLGIADLLSEGPMAAAELAEKTGAHAASLNEMMRALATLEIFARQEDGRFSLTPMGALLRATPGFRSQAILNGEEYFRASCAFLHTARTGEPAFKHVFGQGFYEYFAGNRDAAERFNEVMLLSAPIRYADVPSSYDFSRVATLVDVGGGYGGFTSILLKAYPGIRAILVDSPQVVAGAGRLLEAQGLASRCELVGGSFFESVPRGGDLYVIASVLANWDDDHACQILKNCRAAMGPDSGLLLIEPVLADRQPSRYAAIFAVAVRAMQGSLVRAEGEYGELLKQTGFRLSSIRPLAFEPWSLFVSNPQ